MPNDVRDNLSALSATQSSVTRVCVPAANPRVACAKCARPEMCESARDDAGKGAEPLAALRPPHGDSEDRIATGLSSAVSNAQGNHTRPRDMALEKMFMDTAARAADCYTATGAGDDFGLSGFADSRALPGGVRANMDHRREACEEAADLRNYLVWRAEAVFDDAMAGDALALDRYEWALRCLSKLIPLWRELLRDAS